MTAPLVPLTSETLGEAADILRGGGLVVMPTETVYGLACDASNGEAVARLYAAKGRPRFNPLIAHVASFAMAEREAHFNALARAAAKAFWPGALTLVLPAREDTRVCDLARAGLDTLALRQPSHPGARALIETFGAPLVAPSANRSGRLSPTRAEHAAEDLGHVADLILDAGPCALGIESTILACIDGKARLLRPGAIDREALTRALGTPIGDAGDEKISAPGMLKSHYAPRAQLRLNAAAPQAGEGWLGFGPDAFGGENLSAGGDLVEAAARLFAALRALDQRYTRIAVARIPARGLGEAINDRLARAAHEDRSSPD